MGRVGVARLLWLQHGVLAAAQLACSPPAPSHTPPSHLPTPPCYPPKQVEELKQQNQHLRRQVVTLAAAPPDPHAGKLDGELMRRSRTGPI